MERTAARRRGVSQTAMFGVAIVGLVVLAVITLVAVQWDADGLLGVVRRARADAVEVGQIASNPSAYYGREVRVRASIDLIVDGRALVLTDRAMPQDSTLLAIVPAGRELPGGLEEQEWVVVRGTVRRFDPAQWDLGTTTVERVLAQWTGATAIVAEEVAPVTAPG